VNQLNELLADTWRGILDPRRLWPIALVSGPMILAEAWFTRSVTGIAEAVLMVVAFLLLGPFTWRALFGGDQPTTGTRIAVFAVLGGMLPFVGWVRPYIGFGAPTFLSAGVNGLVIASLFWAGAWGIGRDIEMEQGILQAQERAERMAREAERAQLMALRAHLDPHFLFNTLNAIAEWCREDGEVAEAAVLRLSGLLREVMAGVRAPRWSLSRELRLVTDLWALHQVRDPERFRSTIAVPDPPPEISLPPMVLLPLAENAVKHGPAAGHEGPLELVVRVMAGGGAQISISNPGTFTGPRPGGEGLAMVEKRLALSYGGLAHFHIRTEGERTVATVTVPARSEEAS
jgi:two-component system sensor histidine kinase AlgZ